MLTFYNDRGSKVDVEAGACRHRGVTIQETPRTSRQFGNEELNKGLQLVPPHADRRKPHS